MWFNKLVGFNEETPDQVRQNISINGNKMKSLINGQTYQFGELQIPTLKELKEQAPPIEKYNSQIKIEEVIGDVQQMHCDKNNQNAFFQAASQFNLLEMIGPDVTPEKGVGIYENDPTQGPACAVACGAGTIYRNYFVPLEGQIGQSSEKQIDCLENIGKALNKDELDLWDMKNGYALVNPKGILAINAKIGRMSDQQREQLKEMHKVGIQWDTEVTLSEEQQIVSQIYCSALPVAYSSIESVYWENFARIILEATYEATLHAAMINYEKTGCNKVFLTLVGGGAFGNDIQWISESIITALNKFKRTPLDIKIVSYGRSKKDVQEIINQIN